ncbi:hypothetical protein S40285_10478 [Stachybotrys chlorohalonatus IBT 40285]|uniref:Secreted protein n=1 Tax=Stachybotrys chlorohalonatus (strain IBT 40285) TaxID=1283841 RepID=A0A084QN16_STAC4|nr:hypothetical protein S40285_10478 [Stachybotrys chlorohalonata IBT 40285]
MLVWKSLITAALVTSVFSITLKRELKGPAATTKSFQHQEIIHPSLAACVRVCVENLEEYKNANPLVDEAARHLKRPPYWFAMTQCLKVECNRKPEKEPACPVEAVSTPAVVAAGPLEDSK